MLGLFCLIEKYLSYMFVTASSCFFIIAYDLPYIVFVAFKGCTNSILLKFLNATLKSDYNLPKDVFYLFQ